MSNLTTVESFTGKLNKFEKKIVEEAILKKKNIGEILNDIALARQPSTNKLPSKPYPLKRQVAKPDIN